jgi:preprotein translocase subunit SecE
MEVARYVNLTYAVGFILSVLTFNKLVASIWEGFERLPDIAIVGNTITLTDALGVAMAAVLIAYLYKREDYRTYVSEVMLELKKVTWPTWDETKRGTIVVILFTVVLSIFLWGSDQFWKYVTDLLLLPPGT